jgi:predicted amidohydrolase YtcJ
MPAPELRAALATVILASAAAIGCSRPARLAADLVITRANVWTGNPAQPSAMAVAVIGDRIVDVGSADEIEHWRGSRTTVVNAEGRRLIPGLNDARVRFVDGGTRLDDVDLTDAATPAEFARRINERAKAKPGEWILGGRWDERAWQPAALPARSLIDDLTNSSPVFVVRYDGSMGLANAAALGRAGITEHSPNPPGGAIVRGANGFPTGVLQGTAMAPVLRVVPAMSPEQRLHAVKRALEHAGSLGITSVQDLGATADDIAVYADLANRGELTVRIYAVPAEAGWYDQAKLGVHRAFGSPWLRIGAVHAVFDAMRNAADTRTRLMAADHAALQLSVDAVDAGPASPVLDLFDGIARANGGRDRRFRLGGSRITPSDVARLAALNVVVVLQPGRGEVAGTAAIGNAIHVSLGSGWPDAPLNPMVTLQTAARPPLTVTQALAAQTSGAAFAEFEEHEKGTIARGQLADMVILSDDILTLPSSRIGAVRALTTIVGGTIVHQRKP